MHPITRKAVNAYSSQIAALNGVDRISEKFNVAPSVAQTLDHPQKACLERPDFVLP